MPNETTDTAKKSCKNLKTHTFPDGQQITYCADKAADDTNSWYERNTIIDYKEIDGKIIRTYLDGHIEVQQAPSTDKMVTEASYFLFKAAVIGVLGYLIFIKK